MKTVELDIIGYVDSGKYATKRGEDSPVFKEVDFQIGKTPSDTLANLTDCLDLDMPPNDFLLIKWKLEEYVAVRAWLLENGYISPADVEKDRNSDWSPVGECQDEENLDEMLDWLRQAFGDAAAVGQAIALGHDFKLKIGN